MLKLAATKPQHAVYSSTGARSKARLIRHCSSTADTHRKGVLRLLHTTSCLKDIPVPRRPVWQGGEQLVYEAMRQRAWERPWRVSRSLSDTEIQGLRHSIAVGMPVTRHPLRRSGAEALPHPAPTLGT